jgi:hypothetical protein
MSNELVINTMHEAIAKIESMRQQLAANNPLLDEAANELDRQKEEIESLRQQLAASLKREVMLRGALGPIVRSGELSDVDCEKDQLYCEVPRKAIKVGRKALAATADLDGLILCEKEPLFWFRPSSDGSYDGPLPNTSIEEARKLSGAWKPLYRAWEPK